MDPNTFTAGIKPGGLRNKNDIKLLICYIFASVKSLISKDEIINVLQANSLANYFEATAAFSNLVENGHIECDKSENKYYITESGKLISEQLNFELPVSIREKALSAILNLIAQIRREKENKVAIEKIENGYNVTYSISGGTANLISICIYVPDLMQANIVKKNFHENPEIFYKYIIALATNNRDIAKEILKNSI
ncbi:MAG: DUF4364 family protein [Oscillospiraceae bacterium]|jgi:hypothetical protein|nr:DUF4364 family protein [Oscillospiraceae bacterium]